MKKMSHREMIDLRRRKFLRTGCAVSAGLVAGCGAADYPKGRALLFGGINASENPDGSYRVRINPRKSNTGGSDEWETFHNVTLLGYSDNDELVCRKRLGTIDHTRTGVLEAVTLNCSEFPGIITYRADESPCDDDTEIAYAEYRRDDDGDPYWYLSEKRECDEGLPPG